MLPAGGTDQLKREGLRPFDVTVLQEHSFKSLFFILLQPKCEQVVVAIGV
jgi:hypothetical protein